MMDIRVAQVRQPFSVTETLEPQDARARRGGSAARRTFTLTPLRPGSFNLTFPHVRPWGPGAALATHALAVTVTPAVRFEAVRVHGRNETRLLHRSALSLPYLKAEGQVQTLGVDGRVMVFLEAELSLDPSRHASSTVVEDAGQGTVTCRTCEYRDLEHGQDVLSRAVLLSCPSTRWGRGCRRASAPRRITRN